MNPKRWVAILLIVLPACLMPVYGCTGILAKAQNAFKRGDLELAQKTLQDVELCDIDNKLLAQRQALQRRIFNAMKKLRKDAEAARQVAQKEKAKADSALDVANRVLDKLYFYEDKFGLTLKNVGDSREPRYRYGFINRQGEEVIPFAFEEASPFSVEDGFARVKREGKSYLLDTTGRSYLLATSLAELTPETQALDLHESRPDSFPDDMDQYQNLEIILAYGLYNDRGKIRQLPSGIGSLGKLRTLNLSVNQLSSLPPEFGLLNQLQDLSLSDNSLGSLPPEITQLSQLQNLDLSSNYLSSLPPEFGRLSRLQDLDLNFNQLSSLPPEIGQLSQLQTLDLGYNSLSSLSTEFGQLSQLQQLDLNSNGLSSLPPEFGQLSQLQTLDLGYNSLSSLSTEFGQLSQLLSLDLSANQLFTVPKALCKLPALTVTSLWSGSGQFSISGNPLTHLPDCYLDKFSKDELGDFAKECLNDSLYHVAYQSVENLVRRFPEGAQAVQDELLEKLAELEAAGEVHEDFSKMRALLKPKE